MTTQSARFEDTAACPTALIHATRRTMLSKLASSTRRVRSLLAAIVLSVFVPGAGKAAQVVKVDDFAASVVDGDWAMAARAALASANADDTVSFTRDRVYIFKSVVPIAKPVSIVGNNALIEQTALEPATGNLLVFRVAANDVRFSYLRLQATGAPKTRGPVEFLIEAAAGSKRMRIDHCFFGAMPFSTSAAQAGIGFRVGADDGVVSFSNFQTGVGGVFTQGRATVISDNRFRRPGDMSIAFNGPGANGGVALRNEIRAEGLVISGSIGIEEGANDYRISYNKIFGGYGPGIWCLNVALPVKSTGGRIDHNVIDGGSQAGTSPTALVAITGNCSNTAITDNYIVNAPLGHGGNAAVILPTNEISFLRNKIIPGPKAAGYGLLIYSTGGQLTLRDNVYTTPSAMPAVHFIKSDHVLRVLERDNRWLTPQLPTFP